MWKADEETKKNWAELNEQVKRVHEVEESQYEVLSRAEVLLVGLVMLLVWGGLLIIVARSLWG